MFSISQQADSAKKPEYLGRTRQQQEEEARR
jgi:hypothetical protein